MSRHDEVQIMREVSSCMKSPEPDTLISRCQLNQTKLTNKELQEVKGYCLAVQAGKWASLQLTHRSRPNSLARNTANEPPSEGASAVRGQPPTTASFLTGGFSPASPESFQSNLRTSNLAGNRN